MSYQSALITGASSGIGAAFARALPRATALLLHGRDRDRLNALAQELALNGRQVRTIVADLVDPEGRYAVIGAAENAGVDLVINNAGIGQLGRVIDNPDLREMEMVQVNVAAPVEITRGLLPMLLRHAHERGSRAGLINVASTAAFAPMPLFATYAATKTFLLNYTEALAEELADEPIDVLALCPGATETRFFERAQAGRPPMTTMHSAERVAQEGLRALGQERVHVVGPTNYLASIAMRFLPRRFLTAAVENTLQKWK
ncbi:SDR family NAD(P)-dependent oxidoreductase [Dongia sp.]|uniref:SDR family NAD(P)-dependent oxidoreductase n=1 Tax=Dongia sp. TaxID=1977262 RepID=UPI0035AE3F14